ncbi:hypothetical protein HNP84_000599 [Thermocatellispora tengchongensis]|uniref:Uncharacterized protein n=1 Tax=Thermocatellispora tengchongensis TaxID=1073253 RepID=A0A840NZ24_9ACTN|nr:hypothetical protein [Thermocatellispora tengchongensis]MBB5130911.1 hypothetical protein [Thermocatellispora tengchongensis]
MRVVVLLATGLALIVVAAGCGASEPSLQTAAAELQKDTQRLETDDVFKNPTYKLRILQRPDKDIPCDKDKFKRVMRATADYARIDEPLFHHLDRAQGLMENRLIRALGYELDLDITQSDADEGRFIYGMKGDSGVKVTVYVAPEAPTWRIHAQTACLSK